MGLDKVITEFLSSPGGQGVAVVAALYILIQGLVKVAEFIRDTIKSMSDDDVKNARNLGAAMEMHSLSDERFSQAIQNNTDAITKLTDYLEVSERRQQNALDTFVVYLARRLDFLQDAVTINLTDAQLERIKQREKDRDVVKPPV